MAQIHRFGDCVAFYAGSGQTIYITPKDAIKFAAQLRACAQDVKKYSFCDGRFSTYAAVFTDTGYNGCGFEFIRKATA